MAIINGTFNTDLNGWVASGANASWSDMKIENLSLDFQRIGSIDLLSDDYPFLSFIDKANGFIYTVSDDRPARIVKISINPLSRISSVDLDYDYRHIYCGVIDTIRGFLYLGNDSDLIVKVRLSDLTVSDTLTTSLYNIQTAIIDESNGIAYFGDHDIGYIIKIDLLTFTVIDTVQITAAIYGFWAAGIDTANGYGYFATDYGDGSTIPDAVKIRLSDMTEVASIFLPSGENYIGRVYIDSTNNICYLVNSGVYGFQNKIIKTDISGTNFSRISSIDGVIRNYAGVIDTTRGFLYLAGEAHYTGTPPANMTKIDLSTFSIVDSFNLEPGEDLPDSGVIYEEIGYAYFASIYSYSPSIPPKMVTIAIAQPPSPTGTLNIDSNPSNANIYIDGIDTTMTTPASIDLSIGDHYYELATAASGQTFYYNTGNITIMPGQTIGVFSNLLNLPISPIINGTFDTDISGWTISVVPFCEYNPGLPGNVCGNGDVLWDNSGLEPGRTRIRTYRCCNTSMTQSFIVNSRTFSFDWETNTIYWYENPGYDIVIDGNIVVSEGLPTGYNTSISGIKNINLSEYIGRTATITFYVNGGTAPSGPYNVPSCAALDHNDTFLYIDNVRTLIPIPMETYQEAPIGCPGTLKYSGDAIALNATPSGGIGPYYVIFRKNDINIDPARLGGSNPIIDALEDVQITRVYTLDDVDIATSTGTIDFSVHISDKCPTGAKTRGSTCTVSLGCMTPVCNFTIS